MLQIASTSPQQPTPWLVKQPHPGVQELVDCERWALLEGLPGVQGLVAAALQRRPKDRPTVGELGSRRAPMCLAAARVTGWSCWAWSRVDRPSRASSAEGACAPQPAAQWSLPDVAAARRALTILQAL